MKKTILALGAHFDDVEMGVAGTLMQTTNKVYIAVMKADEFRTGDPVVRLNEQYAALNRLGISRNNLITFEDDHKDTDIIAKLDKIRPDIIFCPFERDTHQDHLRCYMIGQSVGRKKNIITFFYSSGSAYDFYPNVFNIIDFETKHTILHCFKSQIDANAISIDIIEKRECYWGSLISDDDIHAEGFLVKKMRLDI